MQTRKERMAGAMFFSMILLLATAFIGVSLMQDLGIDLVDKLQSLRAKIL
jgi:UPF0716 family protein affecting phage T7 exclusion